MRSARSNKSGTDRGIFGLFEGCSVSLAIKCFPFVEQVVLLALLPVVAGFLILRQPSCSGDPAVSPSPYVRCDVRLADLQEVWTVLE